MSDSGNAGKLEGMTNGPFFTLSKPYLDFIAKGKIFYFVYILMAVISLLFPFGILYKVIESEFFRYVPGKYIAAFILTWFVIAFAGWIGFQLWWDRRKKISEISSSEFIVTPIFSEIIRTFGEWLGTLIAIIGAAGGLIAFIFLGNEINDLFRLIGMGFLNFGAGIIFMGPIIGFFIVIISRFVAEQLRILTALANNTKEIAENLKK